VSGVSFDIAPGQVVCLVGESGSGKSIIAHTVMGLNAAHDSCNRRRVRLKGRGAVARDARTVAAAAGQAMSMIFQEPMTALNPVMTCGQPDRRTAGAAHLDVGSASGGPAFSTF
jgi:peptide/nickel transport system ATP-binding protein